VGIGVSASTRRAIVPASHMCCRLATRRRAMARVHVARRSVVAATSARPTVGIGTAASTRTTSYLSASRSSRWPIVMAGYIRRTTMPRPTTVA
jgi:hypothetical protein